MKLKVVVLVLLSLFSCKQTENKNNTTNKVQVSGAMKNVMRKGQLYGTINLDTISNKEHLFGLGPIEYLSGEITIFDGVSYQSNVVTDTTMMVKENFNLKAPFFVYANASKWNEIQVPNTVADLIKLEDFLNKIPKKNVDPFAFKIEAVAEKANIHIVNLPKGTKVSSPEEAHQGQVNYDLINDSVDLIGFYSTQHKTIFTHHDTNIHVHLLTKDRKKMGHLESIEFKIGSVKLFVNQ